MNEISCEICLDLLPLVQDGAASADSKAAVLRHTSECEACRALYHSAQIPADCPEPKSEQTLAKARRYLNTVYTALMLFGIYFGLSLTRRMDPFYNILIMPAAGAAGALLFGKKAFVIVPALLWLVSIPVNALLWEDRLSMGLLSQRALIYAVFAAVGTLIALLLKYAFGKEKKQ